MPADATLDSLKKFTDPSLWEVRRDVPVFDEHDDYDEAKLQAIAENCNRRESATGDACPLIIGHTVQGGPEPEVVGFARNFKVGAFGPKAKRGILADFYYRRDSYDKAKNYLRRSVELWPDELFFDPIALINRTPKRDLGMLLHSRSGKKVLRYAMEDSDSGAVPYQGDMAGQTAESGGQGGMPRDDSMELSPEEKRLAEKLLSYFRSQGLMGQGPVSMAAGMAGPMNVSLPGSVKMPEQHAKTAPEAADVVRMQKDLDETRKEYAKLAEGFEKYKAETDKRIEAERQARLGAEAALVRKDREGELLRLHKEEGFQFDVADELEFCGAMAAEQYAKHVERIKKNYRRERPPVNTGWVAGASWEGDAAPAPDGRPKELSREDSEKVLRYALEKGYTGSEGYRKARTELFPTK